MSDSKTAVRIVIYPFDNRTQKNKRGIIVLLGSLYVINGQQEIFDVACGPREAYKDKGGHTAEPTNAGDYTLGDKVHYSTRSWPSSVVPWDAPLREQDGVIQYQIGNRWEIATGPHGKVTQSIRSFLAKSSMRWSAKEIEEEARSYFYDPVTKMLSKTYVRNDFGKWAWHLQPKKGKDQGYYIHTTPPTENKEETLLEQSHGCIHIMPKGRDELMKYLKKGTAVTIMKYGEVGPPPGFSPESAR